MVEQHNPATNFSYPSQMQDIKDSVGSITKLLQSGTEMLLSLRREFRGEALYQDEKGDSHWIQVTKPLFINTVPGTRQPMKIKKKQPWGEEKEEYVPNDEAIEEILSQLKFAGVNQITILAGIDDNNYLDDLREFECKLAAILALKQSEWGVDKSLLPMLMFKVKTVVQDARSMAIDGRTLKAVQTTVQRVEQMIEDKNKKQGMSGAF